MFNAILLAFAQLPQREMRRPLILTLAWSIVVLVALWIGVGWGIAYETATSATLRWIFGILGAVAVPFATWFLFPSVALIILSFYSEASVSSQVTSRPRSIARRPMIAVSVLIAVLTSAPFSAAT